MASATTPALADVLDPPAWMADAACRPYPSEWWFPPVSAAADVRTKAKPICARCPVRDLCLAYAVERGEWGVWGGTTEVERRHLRRASNRPSAP